MRPNDPDRYRDYLGRKPEKITIQPGTTLHERLGGREGLERLVKWFYARARYEPILAPIFQEHVHDWPAHLQHITDFWAKITGAPGVWNGAMGRHFRLGLTRDHYEAWLRVWAENATELLPPTEASELATLARNIAEDLLRMQSRT